MDLRTLTKKLPYLRPPSVHIFYGIFLTILGTLRVSDFFLKFEWPSRIGEALMLSPRPDPLAAISGYEDFQQEIHMNLITSSHQVLSIAMDKKKMAELKGPHLHKIPYITAISFYPRAPELIEPVLTRMVCQGGTLAQLFHLPTDIRSFQMTYRGKLDQRMMQASFNCTL
jgi:hypothetical protein